MTITEEQPDKYEGMMVKLEQVLNKDCYYLTKVVATQLQRHGYASVSKFFKNLPQSDLDILMDKIVLMTNQDLTADARSRRHADIMLLAMTLALAEGKVECSFPEIAELMRRLILLSCLTDLDRRGQGKANYELFSLTDNCDEAIFETVPKTEGKS
jgi:hypothetical protein